VKHPKSLLVGIFLLAYGIYGTITGSISVLTRRSGIAEFEGEPAIVIGLSMVCFSAAVLYLPLVDFVQKRRNQTNEPTSRFEKLVAREARSNQLDHVEKGTKFLGVLTILILCLYALFMSVRKYAF
jgi:hypothetical protein